MNTVVPTLSFSKLVATSGEILFVFNGIAYNPATNTTRPIADQIDGRFYLENTKKAIRFESVVDANFTTIDQKIRTTNVNTGASTLSEGVKINCGSMTSGIDIANYQDSKVLIVGGTFGGSVEVADACIYDPETNTFTKIAPATSKRGNRQSTARLPNGKIFVGGQTSELFDPTTNTFTPFSPSPLLIGTTRFEPEQIAVISSNKLLFVSNARVVLLSF